MKLKHLKSKIFIIFIILMLTACAEEKASLAITAEGEKKSIDADTVYNSPDSATFPAVVRSSGEKPVETEYRGIELNKFFEVNNIDIADYEKVTFIASDGYKIILSINELNEPNNIYLTFERDGEILKSKKQGGSGPFQLVIRRDPFSQRWVKHVNEIILE